MISWFTNADPIILCGPAQIPPGRAFCAVDWSQPQPCTCPICRTRKHPQPVYPVAGLVQPWEGCIPSFGRCKRPEMRHLAAIEETAVPTPLRKAILDVLAWTGQHGTYNFPNLPFQPRL
jgi:hypothetical protein